jgi:hypothetical protein
MGKISPHVPPPIDMSSGGEHAPPPPKWALVLRRSLPPSGPGSLSLFSAHAFRTARVEAPNPPALAPAQGFSVPGKPQRVRHQPPAPTSWALGTLSLNEHIISAPNLKRSPMATRIRIASGAGTSAMGYLSLIALSISRYKTSVTSCFSMARIGGGRLILDLQFPLQQDQSAHQIVFKGRTAAMSTRLSLIVASY